MNLYIKNHSFGFETENLTRLFYPNEKIKVISDFGALEAPYIYTKVSGDCITVKAEINGQTAEKSAAASSDSELNEKTVCSLMYKILCGFTNIHQPWGIITGVRPIKLLRRLYSVYGEDEALRLLKDDYFVSPERLSLAVETEKNERKILELSKPESFSLYVGIPFCPSRCSYCSFVMSSVEQAKKLTEPYVALLCDEIKATAEAAEQTGLHLETVYFGGGTPTALSAEQLNRVLSAVNSSFNLASCREFTVEAGRPDTVDSEKLAVLKENKVDRISINPQTINDSVLREIGRRHTARQFFDAFALARKFGFLNINTDLIAGLPGDNPQSFARSLDAMTELGAECVTVHTLCMKRASTLTTNGTVLDKSGAAAARKMLEYSHFKLTREGFIPYYLYRQSRMVGNLENVGWAKPGFEGLYNVYIMDETHTVLACGCGGATKLVSFGKEKDYLQRIFNFKYPYEYISRFDEIMKKKEDIRRFRPV